MASTALLQGSMQQQTLGLSLLFCRSSTKTGGTAICTAADTFPENGNGDPSGARGILPVRRVLERAGAAPSQLPPSPSRWVLLFLLLLVLSYCMRLFGRMAWNGQR